MNIPAIRSDLMKQFSRYLTIASITSTEINSSQLRSDLGHLGQVVAFEIITSNGNRYFTFAVGGNTGVSFTRVKEGIMSYLLKEIRHKDFYFSIINDINNRYDLVGRFLENYINNIGYKTIGEFISHYAQQDGKSIPYATGYKITHQDKHTLTFDGVVEVKVNKGNGYLAYLCTFVNSAFLNAKDSHGKIITMEEVFDIK